MSRRADWTNLRPAAPSAGAGAAGNPPKPRAADAARLPTEGHET